jgi:hypothetical protein
MRAPPATDIAHCAGQKTRDDTMSTFQELNQKFRGVADHGEGGARIGRIGGVKARGASGEG